MRHCAWLSVALSLACGDSLQPAEVVGGYSLTTIDGHAPPSIIVDNPDCRITVTGGSLTITPKQRFVLALQEVMVCPTPTAPGEVAEDWLGTYSLDNEAVILHAVGDPSLDYGATFRSGQLVVPLGARYGDLVFAPDD
jgi:hypothetical protein